MKVLIVFSSRHGVSKHACEMLKEKLDKFAAVDMYDVNSAPPSPANYDVAIVGGSVRMTKISKKLKNYIREHKDTLAKMHSAAFLCCGYTNNFDDYVTTEFPKDNIFSLGIHCFGGELKPAKVSGFDKIIVYFVRQAILTQDPDKSDRDRIELPEIFPDTVYALAERIHMLKINW